MTLDHLGSSARMGALLQVEVERQLLQDLAHYGIDKTNLWIDWSDACNEGHCTSLMDGNLEGLSNVRVLNKNGGLEATGWTDFIHGGGDNPLFVFWLFLTLITDGEQQHVRKRPEIPEHVWNVLPNETKTLCTKQGCYDSRWGKDLRVIAWSRDRTE